MTIIRFVVDGTPQTQGSKTLGRNRSTGAAVMYESGAKTLKVWRRAVTAAAKAALPAGHEPFNGPVSIQATFYLTRPKYHYRTGRHCHLLRDNAPLFPAVKPDVDKLQRALFDAMTDAGVWIDDARVSNVHAAKRWCGTIRPTPGAVVTVWGES